MAAAPRREPAITLHDAIEAAWSRLPERNNLAARQGVAAAQYRSGGAIVPNAPTATGSHVNDRVAGSNYNYITTQVQISTPLWLPGEGTATQHAAEADGHAAEAAIAETHLALASQVIALVTRAALAANVRDVATRRLATDRSLATDLNNRFATGESSQSDALAAEAEAATATVSLAQSETELASAQIALATVTGSEALPSLELSGLSVPGLGIAGQGVPGPAAGASLIDKHPRVAAAARAVEVALANQRLTLIQDRDDPEVGLEGINEKQPGSRWDTRFGVSLTFHFATEARNAPRRAAAEANVTQAEVQLVLARREVASAIDQAQATLAGSERARVAAERAASALEKRRGQIERAWRQGEMPFYEYVRANAQAFDAVAARDQARTARVAALLQLRLAEGFLP